MTTCSYIRNKKSSSYDLENEITYDGELITSISPAVEIVTALPGEDFKIYGNDIVLKIIFENDLEAAEIAQVDTIIDNIRT